VSPADATPANGPGVTAAGGADGGAGAGTGAPQGGSGAAPADGGRDQPGAGTGAGAGKAESLNPHKVPDKFLVDGKPDYNKLVTSYGEAEKALMRKTTEVRAEVEKAFHESRAKAAPATPADYTIEDKFTLGEREISIYKDDPMMGFVRQIAHANQWTQAEFNANLRGWITQQIASLPKWKDEAAKLGPQADARHARVDGFLRANLSQEAYGHFARQPATAALITAFEELMQTAGHPQITNDTAAIPNETLSAQQLREMQRDPRYTGERGRAIDPAFVARVRAGYRALAKNGQGR